MRPGALARLAIRKHPNGDDSLGGAMRAARAAYFDALDWLPGDVPLATARGYANANACSAYLGYASVFGVDNE